MEVSHRKEYFSDAYIYAVAAVAGLTAVKITQDLDKSDFRIGHAGTLGRLHNPKLELQLKCTELDEGTADEFHYDLDVDTYNDLCHENQATPRILVVFIVPREPADWLQHAADHSTIRRCAYFINLMGHAKSTNSSQHRVHIPRANLFTVEALDKMITRIGNGKLP